MNMTTSVLQCWRPCASCIDCCTMILPSCPRWSWPSATSTGGAFLLSSSAYTLLSSCVWSICSTRSTKGYETSLFEGVELLNQLSLLDGSNWMEELHVSLLSLKCFKMGSAMHSVQSGIKDHTSFITHEASVPPCAERSCPWKLLKWSKPPWPSSAVWTAPRSCIDWVGEWLSRSVVECITGNCS